MVRAYLRKLEAREQGFQTSRDNQAKEVAQRKVAAFGSQMKALGDELPSMKAGAKRHLQRLADQAAFNRLRLIKGEVQSQLNAIAHLADTAGVSGPVAPEWLSDLPTDL